MKTAALTGSLAFGFVCFVLAAIGAVKTSVAISCAAILISCLCGLVWLMSKPAFGERL